MLATGLLASAGLVAAVGGRWGVAVALAQMAVAAAIATHLLSPWPPAWAILATLPAPIAAARHWTAGLPGACQCTRLPHPPPGLISLTGLAVLVDVGLLVAALVVTNAARTAEVGKLSR